MRGRTFENKFIIADEMQNASIEQMIMLLTRIGSGSKLIVVGDPSQCDRKIKQNGLSDLINRLEKSSNSITKVKLIKIENKDVQREDVVKEIEKGLYLSNIHYLNWSDNAGGRITGLTRYACFWVEGGEIVAPIETMRFDDSFYRFFGNKLLHVEDKLTVLPEVGTYGQRSLGATKCPGILVDSFELTL